MRLEGVIVGQEGSKVERRWDGDGERLQERQTVDVELYGLGRPRLGESECRLRAWGGVERQVDA